MDMVILAGIVITAITLPPVLWQLRKHPRGLVVLFMAEMWERFSYYGMRGLLIFYLTQHFLFDDTFSQGQYGAYTSLVYLTPLIGGLMADKYLGTRKAIIFGALLLVAGHFTMAFEGKPATQVLTYQGAQYNFEVDGRGGDRTVSLLVNGEKYAFAATPEGGIALEGMKPDGVLPPILPKGSFELSVAGRSQPHVDIMYLALALIVMGVCYLKPNISTIVGQLYPAGDPRRDPGFTLYYYGINLGAFWAAILCGFLGQSVGWWAGFGLAGVGMLAGLVVFQLGRAKLEGHGEPPDPVALKAPAVGPISKEWLIYLLSFAGVAFVWVVVRRVEVVGYLLGAGSLIVLGYLAWFMATKIDRIQRERMILALLMIFASVVFWTLFEQGGSSLNQFAERNTDLTIAGALTMQPSQAQSFNSGFILLLAPVFSAIWAVLGRRNADPSTPLKFALALIQVGAGFLVLVWGASYAGDDYKVPLIFLALAYLLHTTGELCLSPVGLSMVTKLSAAAVVSTMMAVWFLASSWAQWLGGLIAQLTASETIAGQVMDPAASLHTYAGVFQSIGLWAIGIGVALAALSPWLKKMSHGADEEVAPATETLPTPPSH